MSDFYILDCGLATESKRKGFDLPDWKNSIWSAQALIDAKDLIIDIHKENIEAGSDVITTSNYYTTPLILKDTGLDYRELSETALYLAEVAVKSSDKNTMIAGCFPPINVSFRPDLTPDTNEVEDFYETLANIYKDRVDVILCETMASIFEGNIAAKIATKYFDKVWLSWNTRGLDPFLIPSGENLSDAAIKVSEYNLDCQLVNCAHANLITKSLEILNSCVPDIGVYANSSVHSPRDENLDNYENISEVHYHHMVEITPGEYLNFVKEWMSMGSKVIGGCCTTTSEHIRLIAGLKS